MSDTEKISRIDIPMSKVYAGEKRINVGRGIDLVLIERGEGGYEEGKATYRVETCGCDLAKPLNSGIDAIWRCKDLA